MKEILAISLITLFLATAFLTAKANTNGNPFQTLWDAIADLQTQIDDIPSGHGAGNIAFIFADGSGIHVLTNDGRVWIWSSSGWLYGADVGFNFDVPIPTPDIVQWKLTTFLDTNGNVWKWDDGWANYGSPF